MNSPERPEVKIIEPAPIQLELVKLPAGTPVIEPESESEPEPQLKSQPEKKVAEPVETVKPASLHVEQPELVEPLKSEPKKEPLNPIKKETKPIKEPSELVKEKPKPKEETKAPVLVQELITKEPEKTVKTMAEEEQSLVALVQAMTESVNLEPANLSVQELVIKESRKIVKATAEQEQEQDLAALIRAVTKQFNSDQAHQQQAAREQANRKRAEQDRLQAQAGKGGEEQARLDKEATASDEPVNFAAEQASWLPEHEPDTSLPSLVWRNTTTRSGDVFTVLLELHVDKNGYITEVTLLESSGNQVIDAVATVQVRAGQLNPLQQNGLPVNGIVPMSLRYERP